jgi:hypothetical protein
MSTETTKTIIPAQPGYFRLWPYAADDGKVTFRKDAIIAWCVTIEPALDSDEPGCVAAYPVTTSQGGDSMRQVAHILRPDGMVDEMDEPLRCLDEWLANPELLTRWTHA